MFKVQTYFNNINITWAAIEKGEGDDSRCRLNVESESQAGPGMDTVSDTIGPAALLAIVFR